MKLETLVEVISAAHLSHYVEGPFKERGGLHFVAPPGSLKSSITGVLDLYPNAIISSDLTIKQGAALREEIAANKVITLAFPAFEKLYQRHSATAANIEGFILGLTGEGFTKTNWEPAQMIMRKSQALVIGCMTPTFYAQHYQEWLNSGFARRFLWCNYVLRDPQMVTWAIHRWEKLELSSALFSSRLPVGSTIKYDVTEQESQKLMQFTKFQPSHDIGYSLLKKILCALKWKHKANPERGMTILKDFSECLGEHGAILEIPRNTIPPVAQNRALKRERNRVVAASKPKAKVAKA